MAFQKTKFKGNHGQGNAPAITTKGVVYPRGSHERLAMGFKARGPVVGAGGQKVGSDWFAFVDCRRVIRVLCLLQ